MIYWLFGRSGSGKTSNSIFAKHRTKNLITTPIYVLDGDELRMGLTHDLGLSRVDRILNVRRAAYVAEMFHEAGHIVLCAFETPYAEQREIIKEILGDTVKLIYIKCGVAELMRRDSKGLYKSGKIKQDNFEPPTEVDLMIITQGRPVEDTAIELSEYILKCEVEG